MSQQSQDMKPIVIDIEIKKSPRHPPIEARLKRDQSQHDSAPTLEDIEEKLSKAEQTRRNELARRAQTHTDEKRNRVLLKKMSQDMEYKLRIRREMGKLEKAQQKRQ